MPDLFYPVTIPRFCAISEVASALWHELSDSNLPELSGIRPSIGSVGDCFDNAMCESFFATLECELLNRRRFRTQAEARMAVFDFIEGFSNPSRRHSALGYDSPAQLERRHYAIN